MFDCNFVNFCVVNIGVLSVENFKVVNCRTNHIREKHLQFTLKIFNVTKKPKIVNFIEERNEG